MSTNIIDSLIKITNALHAKPWLPILLFSIITLLALSSTTQLKINATPYMIDHQHPSRIADHHVKALFNNSGEKAFIAIVNNDGDIFNSESLLLAHKLTAAFKKISLVSDSDRKKLIKLKNTHSNFSKPIEEALQPDLNINDHHQLNHVYKDLLTSNELSEADQVWFEHFLTRLKPIRKVRSLVTIENITPTDDGIDIHPLMKHPKTTAVDIKELKAEVFNNPLYIGGLIAIDGSATSIQLEFNIAEDDSPAMLMAYQAITDIIDQFDLANNSLHISGPPMIASQTAANMEKDNQTLLPGVLLVILAVLLLSFGRLQGMLIPLFIALLSLIWTLGIMSAMGVKQNIITSMLPVFIIAIAVCDAIHFLSDYYRHLPEDPTRDQRSKAASFAIKQLFWPMLVTTITTALGFASLAWTEVTFVKEFGLFVSMGVIIAWFITFFFLPAMVVLWKEKPPKFGFLVSQSVDSWISTFASFFNYSKYVMIFMMVLIVACGWIISNQLKIDNQVIGYFEEDSKIRIDDGIFNDKFSGTNTNSILIEAAEIDAFKKPEFIIALNKIDQRLKSHDIIGFTYGLPDYIKRLNQTLNNNMDATAYVLPKDLSTELISQYMLIYENGNGRDIFDVVDRKYQNARILSVMYSDRSSEISVVVDDILQYAQSVLPEGTRIRVAGYGEILVSSTNAIIWGQVSSLILASVLIILVVMIIFRSPRIGFLVPIPLLMTLLGVFAIMAASNTDLDVGTSIIAAISFGIGIDYSIHIVSAMQRTTTTSPQEQISYALGKCGKPILINTLALGLGFLVLTLSGYQALINLGYFISLTMALCAIFSLIILPPLVVSLIKKEKEASILNVTSREANI